MIYYRNDVRRSGVDGRALVTTTKQLLAAVGEERSSLSLTLVGDGAIRSLNREHRGKDKPTDVLSFPLHDGRGALRPSTARFARAQDDMAQGDTERMLGDIVISVDTARRQAADYDATLQRELYRLVIHGLLHVMGHDHHKLAERRVMEREERRLADAIALPWPYEVAR